MPQVSGGTACRELQGETPLLLTLQDRGHSEGQSLLSVCVCVFAGLSGYTGTPTLAILRVDTAVYSSPASPCSQTVNTHTWLGQALGRVSIPLIKVYKEVLTPPAAMCHGWGSLQSHHQGDLRLPAAEHCCLSLPGPLLLLVTDSCPSPCDLCQEPVSTRRMQGRRQSARLVSSSC